MACQGFATTAAVELVRPVRSGGIPVGQAGVYKMRKELR